MPAAQSRKAVTGSLASERLEVGVGRSVTIALTEGRNWPLLNAELHCRATRAEWPGALGGVVIVRIGWSLVWIVK
jgi:hypothetical protein